MTGQIVEYVVLVTYRIGRSEEVFRRGIAIIGQDQARVSEQIQKGAEETVKSILQCIPQENIVGEILVFCKEDARKYSLRNIVPPETLKLVV